MGGGLSFQTIIIAKGIYPSSLWVRNRVAFSGSLDGSVFGVEQSIILPIEVAEICSSRA